MMKKLLWLFDYQHKQRTLSYSIVIFSYVLIEVLMHTVGIKRSLQSILVPVCCYIVAAIALNLCVGFSGELSLGHAGFMAIGAFSGVIVSGILSFYISNQIIRLLIAIIVAGVISGIFGLIISIPVLKLEGDYLAIVTLAFGQIIKSLLNNIYLGYDTAGLHFSFVNNEVNLLAGGKMLLSGPMGATDTNKIASFTAGIILILFALAVVYNLIVSKCGRAIMASRDNRIAAQSIGIDVLKTKTLAFVISAGLTGMAGALYALNYSTLLPAKFDFNTSILILVYVVFGGLANISGSIIAAAILYMLPELLRSLQDYRMLIYAVVLILIMLASNNSQLKSLYNSFVNKYIKRGNRNA